MKKIYSLITAVMITSVSFAQVAANKAVGTLTFPDKNVTKTRVFDRSALKVNRSKSNAAARTAMTGNSGWFNYGTSIEALLSVNSELNSNYLFPDSMGYGEFGAGTFAGCWVHHLAEVADFRSIAYSNDAATSWVTSSTQFKIDSLSIFYAYTRMTAANIVDTLVITIYDNGTTSNMGTGGYLNTNGYPGGADTLSTKRLGYNKNTNLVANNTTTTSIPTGQYKFKVLLTDADTAATSYRDKDFKLPVPYSGVGNKLVAVDVQFIPGYTYTLTEHIDYTKNAFFFTSLEENGANTVFNFFDCNFGSTACDYNASFIVPQDVRYNINTSGYNGHFIPAMAYTPPYGFEHHLISFHLTDDLTTGINNAVAQNSFELSQNMPNPYTRESVVNYYLTKNMSSAVFTVTDVTGRIVSTEKVGTSVGSHSVKLGAYAAGIYYYSLNVDGNVTTKKMIVE